MFLTIKSRLVDNWGDAWKWLSVQLAVALVAIDIAATQLPQVAEYLPEGWAKWIGMAIIAGRIWKQAKEKAGDEK